MTPRAQRNRRHQLRNRPTTRRTNYTTRRLVQATLLPGLRGEIGEMACGLCLKCAPNRTQALASSLEERGTLFKISQHHRHNTTNATNPALLQQHSYIKAPPTQKRIPQKTHGAPFIAQTNATTRATFSSQAPAPALLHQGPRDPKTQALTQSIAPTTWLPDPCSRLWKPRLFFLFSQALTWSREEKDACLAETAASFRGGGSPPRVFRLSAEAKTPTASVREYTTGCGPGPPRSVGAVRRHVFFLEETETPYTTASVRECTTGCGLRPPRPSVGAVRRNVWRARQKKTRWRQKLTGRWMKQCAFLLTQAR